MVVSENLSLYCQTSHVKARYLRNFLDSIFTPGAIRDAPLDIWGGGARVFVACKLSFLPPRENNFFFCDQRPTIFFLCLVEEIFCRRVYAFPVRYHLVFFLVNIFFINFDNKLFFSAHIFNKLFFLTFVATNYFFLAPPPPPDIKWCVPNVVSWMGWEKTLNLQSFTPKNGQTWRII